MSTAAPTVMHSLTPAPPPRRRRRGDRRGRTRAPPPRTRRSPGVRERLVEEVLAAPAEADPGQGGVGARPLEQRVPVGLLQPRPEGGGEEAQPGVALEHATVGGQVPGGGAPALEQAVVE